MTTFREQLAARKHTELLNKISSLERELDAWVAATRGGEMLEKHQTQVEHLSVQLRSLAKALREDLEATTTTGGADDLLAAVEEVEQSVLDMHRLWEFFRRKLALRMVPWLRDPLAALDELAWRCYEPVRSRAVAVSDDPTLMREPPLVFFNGSFSPFVLPRRVRFLAEEVIDERDVVRTAAVADALRDLPIPVIGVPWFQVAHLPDGLVVCHEVGHAVYEDFGLKTASDAAVSAALPANHRPAWSTWLSEVFADVYGTLAAGPAFVSSLISFLAADEQAIVEEVRTEDDWTLYPTVYLRVLIVLEALERTGFAAKAQALRADWSSAYPAHAMTPYEDDVKKVVAALLTCRHDTLGGRALPDVISFRADQQTAAEDNADAARHEGQLTAAEVRTLFAAARIAFDADHAAYLSSKVQDRIVRRILNVQAKGPRGRDATRGKVSEADQARHDQAAGTRLRDALRRRRA